jgi:Spy/CpxP family protein refolding chaperone
VILVRALIFSAALSAILPAAPASWAADPGSASTSAGGRASEVVAVLQEYRATLQRLLPLQERELAATIKRREERRHLLASDIISRKEFEESEAAVERVKEKVEETRRAMVEADRALAEATTARALAGLPPLRPGGFEQSAGLIRFNGIAAWSLKTDTPKLQQFFLTRFGRPLPISSYGQTPLHDRMGLDHRDALDVAVHPDSPEGRALLEHLRAAGIPFIAAWTAVPGATSGAHIHVGQPSPRIAAKR